MRHPTCPTIRRLCLHDLVCLVGFGCPYESRPNVQARAGRPRCKESALCILEGRPREIGCHRHPESLSLRLRDPASWRQDYKITCSRVKLALLTPCRSLASNRPMTQRTKKAGKADKPFPPTSIRIDPGLAYRARSLALRNRRDGRGDSTFSAVVNSALAEYLKNNGA